MYICHAWANGTCKLGALCSQRHGLATQMDEDRLYHAANADVFGRPRTSLSATSVFDPLIANCIQIVKGVPPGSQHERRRELESALSEWGQLTKIWFVADERAAFVRFKWRSTAQLFLEALHGRPLQPDLSEVLQLQWATVDPAAVQAQQGKDMAFHAMVEARERAAAAHELYQRLEREGGGASSASKGGGKGARTSSSLKRPRFVMPNEPEWVEWKEKDKVSITSVSAEYPGSAITADGPPLEHRAEDGGTTTAITTAAATPIASGELGHTGAQQLPPGWQSGLDPTSGYLYYYHAQMGVTQWQPPDGE